MRLTGLARLLAVSAVLAAGPAWAADPEAGAAPRHTISVVNDAGSALTELYIEPAPTAAPRNRIAGDLLPPGEGMYLPLFEDGCRFDLKLVLLNETKIERRAYDLCAHPELKLSALLAEDAAQQTLPAPPSAGFEVRTPSPPPPPRGSQFQVEVSPDAAEAEPVGEPPSAAPPPPPGRGVPICPGDARCRKKPGG